MAFLKLKEKWMIDNGFKKGWCSHRHCTTYDYKGYSWTIEDIETTSFAVITRFKKWYDGLITERELEQAKEFCKKYSKKINVSA